MTTLDGKHAHLYLSLIVFPTVVQTRTGDCAIILNLRFLLVIAWMRLRFEKKLHGNNWKIAQDKAECYLNFVSAIFPKNCNLIHVITY